MLAIPLVLCACSAVSTTLTADPRPTVAAQVFSPTPAEDACIPQNTDRQTGKVTKITDGDTIHVEIDGTDYKVRYIGVNAPEDTTQVQEFGPQATEANRKLVEGQTVTLVKDVSETDQYGRLLRYVLTGGTFVNLDLVRQGYARIMTMPPDVACSDVFLDAERQAHSRNLGLWQ
jgi:micrococcal nuclease